MLLQQRVKEQVDEFIKKSLLVLWSHLFSQDYMDDLKLGQANSFMKRHAKYAFHSLILDFYNVRSTNSNSEITDSYINTFNRFLIN